MTASIAQGLLWKGLVAVAVKVERSGFLRRQVIQYMKRNVTVQLDEALLKHSRHLAVEEDMSLSEWIGTLIKNAVQKKGDKENSKKKAIALLNKPFKLGGKVLSREEMHES